MWLPCARHSHDWRMNVKLKSLTMAATVAVEVCCDHVARVGERRRRGNGATERLTENAHAGEIETSRPGCAARVVGRQSCEPVEHR